MHGLEYCAVNDVTLDDAEDCLRLLAVLLNRGQGGLSWPKRRLRSAHIRDAIALRQRAANIAVSTARACSINHPASAGAGMRSVPLAKLWVRRDSSIAKAPRSLQVCPSGLPTT